MIKIDDLKSALLPVPNKLNNPDPITLLIIRELDHNKKLTDDEVCDSFRTYNQYPIIAVTPKHLSRALRIIDTLIKNLRVLKYDIALTKKGLMVNYNDDDIRIYIKQRCHATFTKTKFSWRERTLCASDRLSVKLERIGKFEYVDTEYSRIESKIEPILRKIEESFLKWEKEMRIVRIQLEERQRLDQIKQDLQNRKEAEVKRFKELYQEALHWQKFKLFSDYFDHLQKNNLKSNEELIWISDIINWYHPFGNSRNELLDSFNKQLLL